MTEETAASFQREGENPFMSENTSKETEGDSQSQEENQDEGTQSEEGDKNTPSDQDTPFHEHPRWRQREEEWNTRFNEQERRHQEDLQSIREEFGQARKSNEQNTRIPAWFGGTQEQWDAYRSDRDAELKSAEDRAIERLTKEREQSTQAEERAVAEATTYMRSEMTAIESDKALNPDGVKFDQKTAEKLLKTVLDNNLVDTQGRWNYRAGWRIMQGGAKAPAPQAKKPDTSDRKQVAAATSGAGSKGEQAKTTVATSKDFERDRPW